MQRYAAAPRLPDGDSVDWKTVVAGSWLEVEVGPGRGVFLLERALVEPHAALIGLEIRRKWATIVDDRLTARGLRERARVFAEDAKDALRRIGPDGCVRRLYLHFPDPWWKKRHEKRLVMGDVFLAEVVRLLEPGGELFVQTDVEERAALYAEHIGAENRLSPFGEEAGTAVIGSNPYRAQSNREKRAVADGLPIFRLRYRRV